MLEWLENLFGPSDKLNLKYSLYVPRNKHDHLFENNETYDVVINTRLNFLNLENCMLFCEKNNELVKNGYLNSNVTHLTDDEIEKYKVEIQEEVQLLYSKYHIKSAFKINKNSKLKDSNNSIINRGLIIGIQKQNENIYGSNVNSVVTAAFCFNRNKKSQLDMKELKTLCDFILQKVPKGSKIIIDKKYKGLEEFIKNHSISELCRVVALKYDIYHSLYNKTKTNGK
jgi:hypothetical protein